MESNSPTHEQNDTIQRNSVNRKDVLEAFSAPSADNGKQKPSTRRRFLATTAGTLASMGFIGTAKAIDPTDKTRVRELQDQYPSKDIAKQVMNQRGGRLLSELTKQEVIDKATIQSFDEIKEPEVVNVGEGYTGHLGAAVEVDDGLLKFFVQPEANREYAIHYPDGDDEIPEFEYGKEIDAKQSEVYYINDAGTLDVSPSCVTVHGKLSGCPDVYCGLCDEYEITCCSESNCWTGDKTDEGTCCDGNDCSWVCYCIYNPGSDNCPPTCTGD